MKFLFAIVLTALFVCNSFATSKEDFESTLKNLNYVVKNYSSEKQYEKYEFKHKKTGEVRKFSDFEEVERFTFMVMRGDLLSKELENLYNEWQDELKSAENAPDDEDEASKKQVEEYLERLMDLRKRNAAKIESLAEALFDKWPDKFIKEEKEIFLKSIRDYNDKNKLVERK